MSRKTFRVESITTCADGSIILEGEGVAVEIKRVNDTYSAAHKVSWLNPGSKDHKTTVKEIFETKGGLAF